MCRKFPLARRMSPGQVIALGFALVILTGAGLLMLPAAQKPGVDVPYIDALFTSTSAVCVTGLIVADPGDSFTVFGQCVLAALIQIGGLGVTSIGVGFIILSGKRINMRERTLAKEALNYDSFRGILSLVKAVLYVTLAFEGIGALLSMVSFLRDFPFLDALGISVFHSIAAFNNSGFDILGGGQNLIPYKDDLLLNLVTAALVIFGGLGFFVIRDICDKKNFRRLCLHSKIVLVMSGMLLLGGTLLLKMTENISWLGAFFQSASARTAGFSTYPIGSFTNAGLFVLIMLMFVGASPGSTGGGIKTTTLFVLLRAAFSAATNRSSTAFRRSFPHEVLYKAFIIAFLAAGVVCGSTFLLTISEPETSFLSLLFETVSAFGTVGLSTGITPGLSVFSKSVLILTMYIGRLGPLTMASLWIFRRSADYAFPEESVTIG